MLHSTTKRCSKCGVEKPLSEFHKDKSTLDGLTYACRECRRACVTQWQVQNVEYRSKYRKQWQEKNKEYDIRRKAEWYQRNAEQERERVRLWREQNPERLREQIRAYRKAKPEKFRVIQQRRRAKKYQQGGSYTEQEWFNLKAYYNYTCLCCGRREPDIQLTADHVMPIARGGSSDISNIQPLCNRCNRVKNVRHIDYREVQ